MKHLEHRSDPLAGHRPVRAIAWLTGAVLLFSGAAQADRLDKDPVEKFRQALILETDKGIGYTNQLKGDSLDKALAFRRKNLTETAANLVSLGDLSRALLLVDWPPIDTDLGEAEEKNKKPESFEEGSRRIVTIIRARMAARFNKGIQAVLENPRSSIPAKVAVANLVGETIVKASDQGDARPADERRPIGKPDVAPGKPRLVSDIDTKGFADLLAKMTGDPNARVDVAVAGALGYFREQPKVVGPALKRLLSGSHDEATRLAAATALVNLSTSISNKVSLKGSEPDVTPAEHRRFRRDLEPEDILELVKQITDAASLGMEDSSVAVRRACITAIRNVASEITTAIRTPFSEKPLPPKERTNRSAEEIANIRADRLALNKSLEPVVSTLADYSKKYAGVLGRAIRDPDEAVRIDARKTLRELGRTRQSLRDLRDAIPEDDPKAKPKFEDNELSRRPPPKAGTIRLVAGPNGDKPAVLPAIASLPALRKLVQAPAAKPGSLTNMLDDIERELLAKGVRDPSAKVRRASLEAIESLGEDAAKYLPELTKSLADKDLFVRWITARIVRKLAEEDEKRNRPHKSTDLIIPALVKGLDDEDLDGQIAMTRALGAYGPSAKAAVPALAKLVNKGDVEYRVMVMKALEGIGDDSRSALPEVVAAFKNQDPRVRAEAARLVGQLYKYAGAYIDDLEKLAGDLDPKVREFAGAAILRIQPK